MGHEIDKITHEINELKKESEMLKEINMNTNGKLQDEIIKNNQLTKDVTKLQ